MMLAQFRLRTDVSLTPLIHICHRTNILPTTHYWSTSAS